jgi:pyruvate/2-oxoglutarate dehydrogenase complex dihydrolipoamide acyltransferase (E2) component
MSATVGHFPRERGHTYAFLKDAKRTCHVHLMTDVDSSRLNAARAAASGRISFTTFVVKAAAEIVAACPEARMILLDGMHPRLVTLSDVTAKILFDKTIEGKRCVVSGTVTNPQTLSVSAIQEEIDGYKNAPVAQDGPFAALWKLQRLPLPVMRMVYQAVLRHPLRRAKFQGNFSVTSVGQESVRSILPMIAGTIGIGVGRIVDSPAVRDGQIVIAPMMTLSLTFDHRVLDGALASELLSGIRSRLESWKD